MPTDAPLSAGPAITHFEPLFTAEEAYPAFEKLWLSARTQIRACFRIFDLRTKLRSPEARAIGDTWFDLILHCLDRGVDIDITVSDFDPIVGTEHHRLSWTSGKHLSVVAELSRSGTLTYKISLHPARVGLIPRLFLHKRVRQMMADRDSDALTPGLAAAKQRVDLPIIPATHHQKLCVVDQEALYIGGLDLNERRWDTKDHDRPASETWHDIQAIVRGPVVAAADAHLQSFKSVTARQSPPPRRADGFLRTVSTRRALPMFHMSPKPVVTEIEAAHLEAISKATGPIYLETQFFRHRPIAEALSKAAQRDPGLVLMLVLPAAPEDVAFEGNRQQDAQFGAHQQMEALDILKEGFADRLALAAPVQRRDAETDEVGFAQLHRAPLIYVHSKLSLFGMTEALLSSANLNGRSMRWDTEAGLHLRQPEYVKTLWDRVLWHWLGARAPDPFEAPHDFIHKVNALLAENLLRNAADRPHRLLPFARGKDVAIASPLPGVPDELV